MRRLAIVFALLGFGVGTSWGQTIFNGYAIVNGSFYDLNAGSANPDFQAADLGDFGMGEEIKLGGQTGFWSSGSGVDFIRLFYRVYPTGSPSGAYTFIPYTFQSFSSPDDQWGTDINGANTVDISQNINTNDYTPGNYTLEVYVEGKANNGVSAFDSQSSSNYQATFDILAQIKSGDSFGSTADISITGSFEVESTGTMTVNSGHTLTVSGNITNNGIFNIEDGGYLIQTASGVSGNSGSGTYNVKQASPAYTDDTRFSYWSSPVSGEQLNDVFQNTNTSDFLSYNNAPWTNVSATATMATGLGYTATTDVGSSGSLERTFSSSTVHNGDLTVSGLGTNLSDYILLGNPYPSTLDLDEFETDNSHLGNTFWFWNHQTAGAPDNTQDYATYVKGTGGAAATSGGTTPNRYVDNCQGFMIQFTSAADVTFKNSQRTANASAGFFKTASPDNTQRLWLNGSTGSGFSNQILVAFLDMANDERDEYDGVKLKANANFSMYSQIDTNDFAIQGLSKLTLDETKIIPIGVDLASSGEIRFELDSLDNWPNAYSAYFIDKEANAEHDLLTGGAYVVQLADSGSIRDRFELAVNRSVEDVSTSASNEEAKNRTRMWMSSQELFVQFAEDRGGVAQLDVFDLAGRAVHTSNQNQNRYALTGLDHGTYVVRVTFGDASVKTQTLVNMP